MRVLKTLRKWIIGAGKPWQRRGLLHTALYLLFYISSGIITVVPAGLIYKAVGGTFLYGSIIFHPMLQFILPYLILVAVSIFAEHATYTAFIVGMNPPKGKGSAYSMLLRIKIVLIEDVLPVWKGQMFLIGVGLLIAYLYKHIGAWGFILSAMPVLALRDFFRLWIEERLTYVDTITTLAAYMQHYHPYTRGHLKRVADLSEQLAREMRLPAESVRHIGTAGFLHDIGKIGVSEEILDKTGKLTEEEWDAIKEHPVKGAEIIRHIEFLEGIADWIRYHHKWYEGSGYPSGNGDSGMVNVPIEAAIIATVDAFDAMTDDRELSTDWRCDTCGHVAEDDSRPVQCPVCNTNKRRTYREPKSLEDAIEELNRGAGSQFHPQVVKAFLVMIERERIGQNA
ncbi:MAG: HD domain-containing protein [Armatimonadetes bacterium]|nr:HD domain-containing protein [Armatimonadota bacterium]